MGIYIFIAVLIAAVLGCIISISMGRFLNGILNKKYPAFLFKYDTTKKSTRKQRLEFIFSAQNIGTVAAMAGLSIVIDSVLVGAVRYFPLNIKAQWFINGDFPQRYWDVALPFFVLLYIIVSLVCIDFYFENIVNNTPDEKLKRLIDFD